MSAMPPFPRNLYCIFQGSIQVQYSEVGYSEAWLEDYLITVLSRDTMWSRTATLAQSCPQHCGAEDLVLDNILHYCDDWVRAGDGEPVVAVEVFGKKYTAH